MSQVRDMINCLGGRPQQFLPAPDARASHQEMEAISSPLEPGLALGFALAKRILQKQCCASSEPCKRPDSFHFHYLKALGAGWLGGGAGEGGGSQPPTILPLHPRYLARSCAVILVPPVPVKIHPSTLLGKEISYPLKTLSK